MICVKCQIKLRCKQNGVKVVAMTTKGPIWIANADLYSCPCCNIDIIGDITAKAEANNWQPKFEDYLKKLKTNSSFRVIEYWYDQQEKETYANQQSEQRC